MAGDLPARGGLAVSVDGDRAEGREVKADGALNTMRSMAATGQRTVFDVYLPYGMVLEYVYSIAMTGQ